MAFPFDSATGQLRKTLLQAIQAGSLLAVGCASSAIPQTEPEPGAVNPPVPPGTQPTAQQPAPAPQPPPTQPPPPAAGVGAPATPPTPMVTPPTTTPPVTPPAPVMCEFGGETNRECFTAETMQRKAEFGCGQIAPEPPRTESDIAALFADNGCLLKDAACDGCCNPSMTEGEPQADGSCCYEFCPGACCGRPLIVAGDARVASEAAGDAWTAELGSAPVAPSMRAAVALAWQRDALMEHASIASFARFTLDLMTHGAPPELVAGAQRASLDEVEHARLCFGLARRFGGAPVTPGRLATTGAAAHQTLLDAACAALVEGGIGETLAAAEAKAAAALAGDEQAKAALGRIAEDEERHAALAFSFVAWAAPRLGESELQQLQKAGQDALAEQVYAQTPLLHVRAEDCQALHQAGRLAPAERQSLRHNTIEDALRPCLAALRATVDGDGTPHVTVEA